MAQGTEPRLQAGQPSATAEINAQMRAADAALRPHRRLVDDPYAAAFVHNPRYRVLRLSPGISLAGLKLFDRLFGGMLAEILLRGPYFADVLTEEVAGGVRQAVLLGAGYDTTALRHPDRATVHLWEVDHPATQQVKRATLDRIGEQPANVTFVPVDLGQDPLPERLAAAGFAATEPSVVSWLGVTYYLGVESFQRALAEIGEICAPGSTLVLDYLDPAVVDGTTGYRGARRAARSVRRRGEPYTLGLDVATVDRAAQAAGFTVAEQLRVTDLVRRYGGERPYCRPDDYMGVLRLTRS